jgi:hypothetical protein
MAGITVDRDPFLDYKVARDGLTNHDPDVTFESAQSAAIKAREAAEQMGDPFGFKVQLDQFIELHSSETK